MGGQPEMDVILLLFWVSVLAILYVYLGYPVLVTLLARLRRPEVSSRQPWIPSLTILIAAYNEEGCIARKLENTLALDYPREKMQVIVVADGSDDRTSEIVRDFGSRGVQLLHRPERRGKMDAINRAMEAASGEIVVFSDANNLYQPDALRELVAPFADGRVGVVTGAKLVAADSSLLAASEGLYWKYESFIKRKESRLGCCVAVAGEILALRRVLFSPPPSRVINDDFFMAMDIARRGYRVVYASRARSVEPVSATARDEITRRSRIVAGRIQAILLSPRLLTLRRPLVAWQVVSHKFMRPLVPFAMIGALAANVVLVVWPPPAAVGIRGLAPPWNLAALCCQGIFYGLAVVGTRLGKKGFLGKALYVPVYLVQSNLAALLGIWGLLRGGSTVVWKKVARRDAGEFPG